MGGVSLFEERLLGRKERVERKGGQERRGGKRGFRVKYLGNPRKRSKHKQRI
jgi:hypothetical protein